MPNDIQTFTFHSDAEKWMITRKMNPTFLDLFGGIYV